MGYQPLPPNFIPRQYVQQGLDFLQLGSVINFGKNVLLEVKKEGEPNVVSKKRGRDPTKEKGASKSAKTSKATVPKAAAKKASVKEKVDGKDNRDDDNSRWKDNEVETLIVVRGELEVEFSKAAKKQGIILNSKSTKVMDLENKKLSLLKYTYFEDF
jgi:hypothetical protein